MRDPWNNARLLGVGFLAAGFAAVVLGWYGAAREDYVPAQMPYLLSGGFAGLGLIVAGVTVLVLTEGRRERRAITDKLDQILARLAVAGTGDGTAVPAADTNGHVVAGASTYHLPTCRLVRDREDLTVIPSAEAATRGLRPCRVCEPEAAANV